MSEKACSQKRVARFIYSLGKNGIIYIQNIFTPYGFIRKPWFLLLIPRCFVNSLDFIFTRLNREKMMDGSPDIL